MNIYPTHFDIALTGIARDLVVLVSTLNPERRFPAVVEFVAEVEKQLLMQDTTEAQILGMIDEGCPNTQGF